MKEKQGDLKSGKKQTGLKGEQSRQINQLEFAGYVAGLVWTRVKFFLDQFVEVNNAKFFKAVEYIEVEAVTVRSSRYYYK